MDNAIDIIVRSIEDSVFTKQQILANKELVDRIHQIADIMVKALKDGKRVLWCGNGGSAADAQHLAAELSGRFYYDRPPLNSEALHCNTSYLTAVGNDYGFDRLFARQIEAQGCAGDVFIGISTSGRSKNLVEALGACRAKGVISVAIVGADSCPMDDYDYVLHVPSTVTPRIQECQTLIGHILCYMVEQELYG